MAAELDPKVLQNFEKTLENMNSTLQGMEQILKGVKGGIDKTFNPEIIKSWRNAMHGLKAETIIDVEKNNRNINDVKQQIRLLKQELKGEQGLRVFTPEELEREKRELAELKPYIAELKRMRNKGTISEADSNWLKYIENKQKGFEFGGSFSIPLNEEDMRRKIDLLAKFRMEYNEMMKGSKQRAIELANIQKAENKGQNQEYNRAVREQVQYQKQLNSLRKEYNTLATKKNRSNEENNLLEQTKQKIKDIILLMRQKNNEQKGSYNLGRQLTEYDRIKNKLREINEEHGHHEEHLGKITHSLQHLAGAFGVAFSLHGLVHFGKELVKVRGEYEMQQVALRAIIQNKQVADEIWDKTLKASFQSPFTFLKLSTYTKQLAAYRIETEKLFDTTQMLADVSAGLGVDMQRLILAYGQVKAANYLRASEIRQFTEAGVNILGELSNYFTETRGEMVSTAQVMEMVQKRMVKFEDVEAIFQRMTSAGGIFYNMQYIQSQTIQGQLAKLEDAWDHVLNDIGKANEGVIKDLILALRHIIENWRTWAIVIKSIGWSVAIGYVAKYAGALTGLQKASVSTLRSIAKLRASIRSLTTTMMNNPFMAIVVGVTALTTAMIGLHKKMKETNNEIDEHNMRLYETRRNFEDVKSKIEANNKTLEKAAKGSDKYNKAMGENKSIMQKLLNDYPDLARQMEIFNDTGIIKMNKALDIQIRKLNEEMTIMNAMKQKSWFTDSDKENLEELETNLAVVKRRMASAQHKAVEEMMKIELLPENQKNSAKNKQLYEFYTKVSEIDLSGNILDAVDALRQLHDEYNQFYGSSLGLYGKLGVGNFMNMGLSSDLRAHHSKERGKEALEEQSAILQDAYKKGIRDNVDYNNEINDLANKMMQEEIEKNGKELTDAQKNIINDRAVTIWIQRNIKRINDETIAGINKANETIIKTLGPQSEEMKAFINDYYNKIWGIANSEHIKELESKIAETQLKLSTAFLLPLQREQLEAQLKEYKDEYEAIKKGVDLFATATSKNQNPTEDPQETQSKIDAAWRRRIQLLEEMKRRYDELSSKAYGYAESEKTVRKEFANIWEKEFGDMLSMSDVSFTSDARMQAAFDKFVELAKTKGKEAGEGVVEELGKNAAKYGAKIPIDVQIRAREDFGREIEKMFSDYELTLELQGLNIPQDAAKNLFPDLNYKTLGDLQDRMRKFYNEQTKNGTILMDEEDLKVYRQWADKVDAEILKSRKEKAKEYSKFLEREYSERAKLEMKHAQDVAFVTANVQDVTQRNNIVSNINKKYQEDLNELNWKSFKESDFYVQMMDDISSLPADYTRMMLDKLDEIISHPEKLSTKALKEAIKARKKVLETQLDIAPLEVMGKAKTRMNELWEDEKVGGSRNIFGMRDWKETQKKAREEMVANQIEINDLEKEAESWDKVAAAMKLYEDAAQDVETAKGKLDEGTKKLIEDNGAEETRNQYDAKRLENQQEIDKLQSIQEKRELSPAEKDKLANLIAQNSALTAQIALINDLVDAEIQAAQKKETALGSLTPKEQEKFEGTATSTEASAISNTAKKKADDLKKRNQWLKEGVEAYEEYGKSFDTFGKKVNKIRKDAVNMGKSLYETWDALGGETDVLTDGWMKFGETMADTITQAIEMIPTMVTAFVMAGESINAAMGIIGLIAEAIQLLLVGVKAIAGLHDAYKDKEIETHQKNIEALKADYEALEKQIEKTWSTVKYMQTYEKQVEKLKQQQEELRAQRTAEEQKKDTDSDKVKEYNDSIKDIDNQLEELKQKQIEVFGGLGETNYRSAAEEFVSAWKDAFLETGDGLSGLQEHFNEFLQEWFVKQATMRIAGRMLEPLFKDIDKAVDQYSGGGANVMMSELAAAKEKFAAIAPQLSDALEALAGQWDLSGEGGLSGLAASIQGMTEEQANILEAYWNSVRMYTASIDENVSRIAAILGAGGVDTNPQLQQLELIARHTQNIHDLLSSTILSGHSKGGKGIRVFVE